MGADPRSPTKPDNGMDLPGVVEFDIGPDDHRDAGELHRAIKGALGVMRDDKHIFVNFGAAPSSQEIAKVKELLKLRPPVS